MKTALALAITLLCGAAAQAAPAFDDSADAMNATAVSSENTVTVTASGYYDSTNSLVTWRSIAGVITAPKVDNPVAVITDSTHRVISKISSGTAPWTTRSGSASVDRRTGYTQFNVRGLVLNGGNASGTAGPINQVTGTLVCNPGSRDTTNPQAIIDTSPVRLSALGSASFTGVLRSAVPYPCANPLFLVRIGPAFGDFAGRWLATGVEPVVSASN